MSVGGGRRRRNHAQVGHADAECAAGQRDEEAFSNQLPNDAAARRTNRKAHGDFAAAHGCSTLEETRDIGAGHAQHREGQPAKHQHERCCNRIGGGVVGEIGANDQRTIGVRRWILTAERYTEHREFGSGCASRTGPQAAADVEHPEFARVEHPVGVEQHRRHRQWNEEGGLRERDTDNPSATTPTTVNH